MFHFNLDHTGATTNIVTHPLLLKWTYTTGLYVSNLVVSGGVAYVGSGDRKLYTLNASTRDFKWSYTTGDVVYSSLAVSGRARVTQY